MKKLLAILFVAALLACGGNNGVKLGEDVCDCYRKANSLPANDPNRISAQQDCVKKQGDAWNKVKGDQKKSDEFNKIVAACGSSMIQSSLK